MTESAILQLFQGSGQCKSEIRLHILCSPILLFAVC